MTLENQHPQSGQSAFKTALNRQVTRKEFLAIAATGVATLAGLDRFTKILNSLGTAPVHSHRSSSQAGFGGGPYGR